MHFLSLPESLYVPSFHPESQSATFLIQQTPFVCSIWAQYERFFDWLPSRSQKLEKLWSGCSAPRLMWLTPLNKRTSKADQDQFLLATRLCRKNSQRVVSGRRARAKLEFFHTRITCYGEA